MKTMQLLEEGLELYRCSFRGSLWIYGCTTLPFLLTILIVWQRFHGKEVPDMVAMALLLTMLYVVYLLGGGAYNRRLLKLAGGEAPAGGAVARCAELWGGGALLGIWAVTVILIFPAPLLYAAVQYVPLDQVGGTGRALRRAARWFGGIWAQFALMLLFGGLLYLNLIAVAMALPLLGAVLLGASGVMARASLSGALLTSGLFWLSLLAAVFFALDPLWRCVMVASYRRLGAASSADDLWQRLRAMEENPAAAQRAIR